jgi:hypothetical protein
MKFLIKLDHGGYSINRGDGPPLAPTPRAKLIETLKPHGFATEHFREIRRQLASNGVAEIDIPAQRPAAANLARS